MYSDAGSSFPDLKDRWREIAQAYSEELSEGINNVFYDYHALVALLFGDQVKTMLNDR